MLLSLTLILLGLRSGTDFGQGVSVNDSLRVLVHEGGPRFTAVQPELVTVTLVKTEGSVITARLLGSPRGVWRVAAGDTIRCLRVQNYPHPVLVTDKYLRERRHSYIIGCDKCRFSELFDCPSDLAAKMSSGEPVSTFTSTCPICGGGQLVRLLPSTPSTPRGASAKQLATAVRSIVGEQLQGHEGSTIALEKPLRAYGVDELDFVAILFALEEHFVVYLPEKQLGDYAAVTLRDLIKVVERAVAERRDDELLQALD